MKEGLIVIVRVDYCLLFGTRKEPIETFLQSMKNAKRKDGSFLLEDKGLEFTKEGGIESFLGVNIERDGEFVKTLQLLLIERILRELDFHVSNVSSNPNPSTHMLHKDEDGIDRKDT